MQYVGDNMNSCELVTSITLIACNIAKCYSTEELDLISSIFSLLGETLETIVAQQQLCEANKEKKYI